jgi:hypothetical protein
MLGFQALSEVNALCFIEHNTLSVRCSWDPTLQRAIFPPEGTDVRLALFGVEELRQMGEHWHGGESPGVVKPVR